MPGWAPNSSVSWLPVGLGELPPLVCMEENNHSRTLETYPEDRAHGALVSHWASPRSQVLPRGGVWWCPNIARLRLRAPQIAVPTAPPDGRGQHLRKQR